LSGKISELPDGSNPAVGDYFEILRSGSNYRAPVPHARRDFDSYISGLEVSWVSASAIDIGLGDAYVESLGSIVRVTSVIHITSISLGNSTWGYVYLKSDGTGECNTTAPATPYAGTARSKTSDTSSRFLGAVRTDGSGNIYRFRMVPTSGFYRYQGVNLGAAPFRVLTAGTATTATAVSCSAAIPPQSRLAWTHLQNTAAGVTFFIGSADYTVSATVFEAAIPAQPAGSTISSHNEFIGCDASQNMNYINSAGSGGSYIDIHGFVLDR
jgi:hypothetical protein